MSESTSDEHSIPICKLTKGDIIGGIYTVERKIGSGKFADIWLTKSYTGSYRAIKIYKPGYKKYFENEVKIFTLLKNESGQRANKHVIPYIESFPLLRASIIHVESNGDIIYECNVYLCTAMVALGENIYELLKYVLKKTDGGGLPIGTVKSIMRDILDGLSYIHSRGVVHADIKPENILLTKPISRIQNNKQIEVVVADVGSSIYKCSSDCVVGTFGYISPEIIMDLGFNASADIWSVACICFELITGDMLFDYNNLDNMKTISKESPLEESSKNEIQDYSSAESSGKDESSRTLTECKGECSTNKSQSSTWSSGTESYNGFSGSSARKYKSLILMRDLLGPMPLEMAQRDNKFHTNSGDLIFRPILQRTTLQRLLLDYGLTKRECVPLCNFIMEGLKYNPDERISAEEWRRHPWLTGGHKKVNLKACNNTT